MKFDSKFKWFSLLKLKSTLSRKTLSRMKTEVDVVDVGVKLTPFHLNYFDGMFLLPIQMPGLVIIFFISLRYVVFATWR
jgi:hypothetical protein